MSQSYPWLKMPHREYMISASYMALKPIERLALLELAMYAHTRPNNSLPDDDNFLAAYARLSTKQWLKIKASVFSEWFLVDGFWLLPDWFSVESAPVNQQQDDDYQDNSKPLTDAERAKRYRESKKNRDDVRDENKQASRDRHATVTAESDDRHEASHDRHGQNVTNRDEMGGKGGDLDLDLNKDLDLKQELNSHSKTREAEKNSRGFFDDELRPDLNLLNAKLGANLVTQKFIDENLFSFNSHYETHQLTDNQRLAKWIAWWKGEQAKQQAQTIQRPSKKPTVDKYNGFAGRDYSVGINDDGSF